MQENSNNITPSAIGYKVYYTTLETHGASLVETTWNDSVIETTTQATILFASTNVTEVVIASNQRVITGTRRMSKYS